MSDLKLNTENKSSNGTALHVNLTYLDVTGRAVQQLTTITDRKIQLFAKNVSKLIIIQI